MLFSKKTLSPGNRKYLKAKANRLDPVVMIGQNGLTENIIQKTDDVLRCHELIKVRFIDFKDAKDELVFKLTNATDSCHVATIGHVAILFRPNAEKEKQQYKLPLPID